MIIILLVVAAVVVGAPLACLVLVSLASLREDHAHSLSYQPAGVMQAAARRMLGFHGDAISGQAGDPRGISTSGYLMGGFPGDLGIPAGQDLMINNGGPDDSSLDGRPDLRDLVG